MASSKTPRPTFTEADVYHYCLLNINKYLREPVFRLVLCWINPQWSAAIETFACYLVRINLIAKEDEFISKKNRDQKEAIRKDALGKSWDVSLTYSVIKEWNSCLADKKDQDAWTKESDRLEYFITKVKNDRNKIGHITQQLDEPTFKEWCINGRDNLEDLLSRVRSHCSHVTQKEIDEERDKVRSFINEIMNSPVDGSGFEPLKYEEYKRKYKKEMEENRAFVRTEGKGDLKTKLQKRNCLEITSYLAIKKDLPIDETYVDMTLDEGVGGKEAHIEVKDLFDKADPDSLYYFEGRAGVGKTSLIKYLSMIWTHGRKGDFKGLEKYDLFFQMSFRDHISSFDQFLTLAMPTVCEKMSIDKLYSVLHGLQSIIVFDGYDEKNEKSAQLLREVLTLKKYYPFTLIVTSRPEATKQFRELVNSHGIPLKRIKVLGIPKTKRAEFLHKYAISMGRSDDTKPLLRYVKRTEHRLSDVWELPYNLSILVMLWMNDHSIIDSITTSLELHWHMHEVYKSKLRERLLNYYDTKHLHESVLDGKIEDFLYVLCETSLTAIVNNDINLPTEVYETLFSKCQHLEIPTEELLAAFLKPSQSDTGERYYSYPHKGVTDFLAALFIHKELNSSKKFDIDHIQQQLAKDLVLSNAPEEFRQQMKAVFDNYKMQSDSSGAIGPQEHEGGKIRKILKEITAGATEKENEKGKDKDDEEDDDEEDDDDDDDEEQQLKKVLSKFHNMLLSLIGILHIEEKNGKIFNAIKEEALQLLRDTGVKDKDHWLRLLNDVKCDDFVATFIAQRTGVLGGDFDGKIKIDDGNLFAYNSLFKATKSPLGDDSPKVDIQVRESIGDIGDFLSQMNRLKLRVRTFLLTENNFAEYAALLRDIQVKFVSPENVSVRIELLEKERKPLRDLWKNLRHNGLHVRILWLWDDFRSTSAAAVNFDESDVIKEILPSCKEYIGTWNPIFQMRGEMEWIRVSLEDQVSYDNFFDSLATVTKLNRLDISFRSDIIFSIKSIPQGIKDFYVYITDLKTTEEAEKVGNILRGFSSEIHWIYFPRCLLKVESVIDYFHGVSVTGCIVFPENLRPQDQKEESQLQDNIRASMPCDFLDWLNEEDIWEAW